MGNSKLGSTVSDSTGANRERRSILSRKQFLRIAGASVASIMGMSACTEIPNAVGEEDLQIDPDPRPDDAAVWLGSGDVGLLNFIYAYVALEMTFYDQVMEKPYPAITEKETRILSDIRKHETAHHDFLSALLSENAIDVLQYDFSTINFGTRNSVLRRAFHFENVGVSIYNNIGEYFDRNELFLAVSKIASVEARHATALQFLLDPTDNFVDFQLVNEHGLDVINVPSDAYDIFKDHIVEELDISGLT